MSLAPGPTGFVLRPGRTGPPVCFRSVHPWVRLAMDGTGCPFDQSDALVRAVLAWSDPVALPADDQ